MSKVRERPANKEPPADRQGSQGRQVVRERVRPTPVPPREVSKYVRWLAWMVGVLALAGTISLIWWGFGGEGDDIVAPTIESIVPGPTAPNIDNIDPHESPEILRTRIPGPTAPNIDNIDPHESPEILRIKIPGPTAPNIDNIDPHESPEILRIR